MSSACRSIWSDSEGAEKQAEQTPGSTVSCFGLHLPKRIKESRERAGFVKQFIVFYRDDMTYGSCRFLFHPFIQSCILMNLLDIRGRRNKTLQGNSLPRSNKRPRSSPILVRL